MFFTFAESILLSVLILVGIVIAERSRMVSIDYTNMSDDEIRKELEALRGRRSNASKARKSKVSKTGKPKASQGRKEKGLPKHQEPADDF